MLKSLAAVIVLAASFAAPASATVFKFQHLSGDGDYQVYAHNTLAGCPNKKGTVGKSNTWLQMDWRGWCTDSCVDFVMLFDSSGYCMQRINIIDQCNTQTFTLNGDGTNTGYSISGTKNWYKYYNALATNKEGTWTAYGCPVTNGSIWNYN
jgi:hypothetical protein